MSGGEANACIKVSIEGLDEEHNIPLKLNKKDGGGGGDRRQGLSSFRLKYIKRLRGYAQA